MFIGWNTEIDSSGTSFSNEQEVRNYLKNNHSESCQYNLLKDYLIVSKLGYLNLRERLSLFRQSLNIYLSFLQK